MAIKNCPLFASYINSFRKPNISISLIHQPVLVLNLQEVLDVVCWNVCFFSIKFKRRRMQLTYFFSNCSSLAPCHSFYNAFSVPSMVALRHMQPSFVVVGCDCHELKEWMTHCGKDTFSFFFLAHSCLLPRWIRMYFSLAAQMAAIVILHPWQVVLHALVSTGMTDWRPDRGLD